MGKVYSPEAVQAGQIPAPGAHEQAGRYILDTLFEPADEIAATLSGNFYPSQRSGVLSGMVYGSTVYGNADIRSDLDFLAVYDPRRSETALPLLRQTIGEAHNRYKVHVEANLVYEGALDSKHESVIDSQFAANLIAIQEQDEPRWSYNWPVSALRDRLYPYAGIVSLEGVEGQQPYTTENPEQLRNLAIRYCSGKVRSFAKALGDGNSAGIDYDVFQRALELPAAIGRKILPAILDDQENLGEFIATQKAASSLLLETLTLQLEKEFAATQTATESVGDKHHELALADIRYTEFLELTLAHKVNHLQYAGWLDANYLSAVSKAHDIALFWTGVLRDRRDTAECIAQHRDMLASSSQMPYDLPPQAEEDDYSLERIVVAREENGYFADGIPIPPEPTEDEEIPGASEPQHDEDPWDVQPIDGDNWY